MYSITKRLGGYPCAHRQHAHDGHCRHIHGYSLTVELEFEAAALNDNGFVIDFGAFATLKSELERLFEHTLLINADDPLLATFKTLHEQEACRLVVLPNVSMESRARIIHRYMDNQLHVLHNTQPEALGAGITLTRVTIWENEKNAGRYVPSQ